MRPAISDSLISGQPLYLLYSNLNPGARAAGCLVGALPGDARDRQRQVARDRKPADHDCGGLPVSAAEGPKGQCRSRQAAQHLSARNQSLTH